MDQEGSTPKIAHLELMRIMDIHIMNYVGFNLRNWLTLPVAGTASSTLVPRLEVEASHLASNIGAKCYLEFRRSSCSPRWTLLGEFMSTTHKWIFPHSDLDDKGNGLLDIGGFSETIDALGILSKSI